MLNPGDSIFVTSGKLQGAKGIIEKASVKFPGAYICKLTSLKPPEIKILYTSQFCKTSVIVKHKAE